MQIKLLSSKVQNKDKRECEIFEIKHSKETIDSQYRHIADPEKIAETEKQFGKVVRRCVLYKESSKILENGIEYKNVEEFLCALV